MTPKSAGLESERGLDVDRIDFLIGRMREHRITLGQLTEAADALAALREAVAEMDGQILESANTVRELRRELDAAKRGENDARR